MTNEEIITEFIKRGLVHLCLSVHPKEPFQLPGGRIVTLTVDVDCAACMWNKSFDRCLETLQDILAGKPDETKIEAVKIAKELGL